MSDNPVVRFLLPIVAALALAGGAQARPAAEPIVGTWTLAGGGSIDVAAGAGTYVGTVRAAIRFGKGASCPAHPAGKKIWEIRGSGTSYTGIHHGYQADCSDQALSSTWTVTGDRLRLVIAVPGQASETWNMTRAVQSAPTAACSTRAALPRGVSLTGVWSGGDGAAYFLRQVGTCLWWYGAPTGPSPAYSNVFAGTVLADGTVTGQWADVPQGRNRLYGTLRLAVRAGKHGELYLDRLAQTGGFGLSSWTRTKAG